MGAAAPAASETTYVVDTSSWVDLAYNYPLRRFPPVWKRIDELIDAGRCVSPIEVYHELQQRDDELAEWARSKPAAFPKDTQRLLELAAEVVNTFKDRVSWWTKLTREADPFVVALGLLLQESGGMFATRLAVASQETRAPGRTRIPDVCVHYGIEHIRAREIVVREDWHF